MTRSMDNNGRREEAGRLGQRLRESHDRSIFGCAGANNTKRQEVRKNRHGFQGYISAA